MDVGDQVKSWKRKCSLELDIGIVGYFIWRWGGGSGTNDGLCGWRYIFMNKITDVFLCSLVRVPQVSFVGTTLIYPPSLPLFLSFPLSPVFLSLAPVSLCPSSTFALFLLYSSKSLFSSSSAPWVKLDFHLSNFTHLSASLHSFYIIIARHEIFSQRHINHLHKVWVTSEKWSSRHLRHSTLHTY